MRSFVPTWLLVLGCLANAVTAYYNKDTLTCISMGLLAYSLGVRAGGTVYGHG